MFIVLMMNARSSSWRGEPAAAQNVHGESGGSRQLRGQFIF
jgi:hypothetical protein